MSYPGNQVIYAYNIRDWVTAINDIGNTSAPFAAAYSYKADGNIDLAEYYNPLASSNNRYTYDYTYDGLSRLTGADFRLSGSNPAAYDLPGITYDDAGNLSSLVRNKETGTAIDNLTYNYTAGTNRLQSVADGVAPSGEDWDAEDASFGYDANGNITSQTGKFTSITYDHRNLPTSKTLADATVVEAWYSAEGQRFRKAVQGGDEYLYILDGALTLAVLKNDSLLHWNIIGAGIEGRQDAGGARRFYIKDNLSSTRAVVNASGTPIETYDYDPWGLTMPGRFTQASGTIEKFTGKERDTETGTDYFGAREYDAAIGRWMSVDPAADKYPEWSTYNYTLNNPLNVIDPDGRMACDPEDDCSDIINPDGSVNTDLAARMLLTVFFDVKHSFEEVLLNTFASLPEGFRFKVNYETDKDGNEVFETEISIVEEGSILEEGLNNASNALNLVPGGGALGLFSKTGSKTQFSRSLDNLNKKLASEEQLGQAGKIIAGGRSGTVLREAGRLSDQYGGNIESWVKKTSTSYTAKSGTQFQTHWYENLKTGQKVEFKTKIIKD